MKTEILNKFESFLDDHKEYLEEHKNRPPSPHKPRYQGVNTTAENEFNVYSVLNVLNETELQFLYELINEAKGGY